VVEPSGARRTDPVPDARALLRVVTLEPAREQLVERRAEAQQHPGRVSRPRARGGLEDARDLGIVEPGHDGPDQHRDRHAGRRETLDHLQAPRRRRGARLHAARELRVEPGDRQPHVRRVVLRIEGATKHGVRAVRAGLPEQGARP